MQFIARTCLHNDKHWLITMKMAWQSPAGTKSGLQDLIPVYIFASAYIYLRLQKSSLFWKLVLTISIQQRIIQHKSLDVCRITVKFLNFRTPENFAVLTEAKS